MVSAYLESSSRVDGLCVCYLPNYVPGNAKIPGKSTGSPNENGKSHLVSQINGWKVLPKQKLHGRVHPHRSKFQYLLLLSDQVERSQVALVDSQNGLRAWLNAEIYDISLASVPGAEWKTRVERLLTDASYLISRFDELAARQKSLHSMVRHLSSLLCSYHGH